MDFVADYIELELKRAALIAKVAHAGFLMGSDTTNMEDIITRRHANLSNKIGPVLNDKSLSFLDS